jgi:Mg2+-importing ATPase
MEKQAVARQPVQDLLAQLHSSEQGLRQTEVTQRRLQYGPNALKTEQTTALRVLGRQFQSALIYFLIVAAVLAFATQDLSDGVIITVILLINAGLGFSQEYRSERAVEKLAQLISAKILVTRDGTTTLLDVADLVPGDVVTLQEGDIVPADLKLLTAEGIQVDESQLTGESVPVPKAVQMGTSDGEASLLFAGSTVDKGAATGVVYATANETELGKTAALSTSIHKVTQYEKSLRAFSALLMKTIGIALAVTLVIKVVLGGSASHWSLLLIFVIALAVAVVPEALPVIATLTMSRGALTLAREKVVVKRLSSLEDLGNVTLLCTDKTGTLTENKLTIQRLVSSDDQLFQTLAVASMERASGGQQGTQSGFDAAFAAYIPADIVRSAGTFTIVTELPFDPADRRRRVIVADSARGTCYLVVIGSAETLLTFAHSPSKQQYLDEIAAEGKQGLRHLALAYKELAATERTDSTDILAQEKDVTFLGFVTLADPLRASTAHTIVMAQKLGVAIKILTGDSKEVAAYVARQVGLLPDGATVSTGEDLAQMAPDAFARAVTTGHVFARVSPEQKFAIITALKAQEVVGYQGDGINDAPSLKLADVGIAVDSATEVAKANADIILLDSDLGVIINAIRYGRTIFANINKYIKYTMVGNFGNFFALAILYLLSTDLPLLPRQVLLISLLTDLPLVAISTDTVNSDELKQPDRYSARALLSISLVLGTLTALFELAFFLTVRGQVASASQTSLYLFFSFTQLIVILSIRNRDHFWKATTPSRQLMGAMALTGVLVLAIPFVHPIAGIFSFSTPLLSEVGVVVLMTLLYVIVLDLVKVFYYRVVESPRAPGWLSQRTPAPRTV